MSGAPNNDTLYSQAWVYLKDEPIILSVSEMRIWQEKILDEAVPFYQPTVCFCPVAGRAKDGWSQSLS